MTSATLSQAEVIKLLKGQTLHIPDLSTLFSTWPEAQTSKLYPDLHQKVVKDAIQRIAVAQPSVERRRKDDIGLLAALWYPQADEGRSPDLARFAVWLVCWDDEVDANEGDLAGDLESADAWRDETLSVLRQATGFAPGAVDYEEAGPLNQTLLQCGTSFVEKMPEAQRLRVLMGTTFFIKSCAVEQATRLKGEIPGYESYMDFRLGTVGGGILCALVEYANGTELPASVTDSEHVAVMTSQISTLLSIVNDLLSLKKELSTDCAINAVATLLTPERTLADVVAELIEKLKAAITSFDNAAASFIQVAGEDQQTRSAASEYITGCRNIVTGTLEFT